MVNANPQSLPTLATTGHSRHSSASLEGGPGRPGSSVRSACHVWFTSRTRRSESDPDTTEETGVPCAPARQIEPVEGYATLCHGFV